jgi:hypothetical protein
VSCISGKREGVHQFYFILFLFPFARSHFDWPITIVLGKHLTLPQNRSVERGLLLAHLYMLWKFNFGQQLWHKLRCYWEHLEEHIGNLVNMLGMSLQTCGRKILRTRREQLFGTSHPRPPSVQMKRAWPPSVHIEPFHRLHENFIHKIVCYNFRPWLISLSKKHGYLPIILYGCVGTHPPSWGAHTTFFFLFLGGWKEPLWLVHQIFFWNIEHIPQIEAHRWLTL